MTTNDAENLACMIEEEDIKQSQLNNDSEIQSEQSPSQITTETKPNNKLSCMDYRTFNINDNDEQFDQKKMKVADKSDRKFTDPLCCLCLLVMIICDVLIFGLAFNMDPPADKRFLYEGVDYKGELCKEKLTAWYSAEFEDIRICVNDCNDVEYDARLFEKEWCVPDWEGISNKEYKEKFDFDNASAMYARVINDLWTEKWYVFVTCMASILTSFAYLFIIKHNYRLWFYFIMNVIFGGFAGILLIVHGVQDLAHPVTDNTAVSEIIVGVIVLLLALWMMWMLWKDREKLTTDIEMMAEAIMALSKFKSILIFATFYAMMVIGFFVYWVMSALYIYSVRDEKTGEMPEALQNITGSMTYTKFSKSDNHYEWWLVFHGLFGIYIAFLICYIGYAIVSYVILVWYEENEEKKKNEKNEANEEDEDDDEEKEEPIWESFMKQSRVIWEGVATILRYHTGTASFAAIVSIFFCCKKNKKNKKDKKNEKNEGDKETKKNEKKNEKNDEDDVDEEKHDHDERKDETEMVEIIKEGEIEKRRRKMRKEKMYNDIKRDIFPLIEEKIGNLAYQRVVAMLVKKKMDHIIDNQMDDNIEKTLDPKNYNAMDHVTPGGPEIDGDGNGDGDGDEEKYGNSRESANKNENSSAGDDKNETVLSVIKKQMNDFEYEQDIRGDIEKMIDKEIEKYDIKMGKTPSGSAKQMTQFDVDSELNKDGLTFTALYGTSYAYSSYRAIKLKKLNETRLNVSGYSNYNEMFGRIGIASFNTAIIVILMFIRDAMDPDVLISSFVMPSLVTFICSYTIGYIFTMLLESTVSTLLFCLILDENKWNKRFPINQGKIKQNVSKLGGGLSAMLAEHLLIMQLKEKEVNQKIEQIVEKVANEKGLKKAEIERIKLELRNAKKNALATERELLESIDGPMKLTEYLINVILVENYFNLQYKDKKIEQENARKKYEVEEKDENGKKTGKNIFNKWKGNKKKSYLKKRVKKADKVKDFLSYYPVGDSDKFEKIWIKKINRIKETLESKPYKLNFKLSGAKRKGIERAFYKSFYSYHDVPDGYRCLTDVLRCSFVFNDFKQLYKCFATIVGMTDEFEILRVKDRFNSVSEPCGYRDLMINVFCKNEREDKDIMGIVCEVQLHHEIFYKAKKVSHTYYKRTRLFDHGNDENAAYDYAKKYVRPVLGRFKIYPMDQDEPDILKIIEPKITKLADEFCKYHVMPVL